MQGNHGSASTNRSYRYKLEAADVSALHSRLNSFSKENGYSESPATTPTIQALKPTLSSTDIDSTVQELDELFTPVTTAAAQLPEDNEIETATRSDIKEPHNQPTEAHNNVQITRELTYEELSELEPDQILDLIEALSLCGKTSTEYIERVLAVLNATQDARYDHSMKQIRYVEDLIATNRAISQKILEGYDESGLRNQMRLALEDGKRNLNQATVAIVNAASTATQEVVQVTKDAVNQVVDASTGTIRRVNNIIFFTSCGVVGALGIAGIYMITKLVSSLYSRT